MTKKYDETMNALEKFAQEMKKSDEIIAEMEKNPPEPTKPIENEIVDVKLVPSDPISPPVVTGLFRGIWSIVEVL